MIRRNQQLRQPCCPLQGSPLLAERGRADEGTVRLELRSSCVSPMRMAVPKHAHNMCCYVLVQYAFTFMDLYVLYAGMHAYTQMHPLTYQASIYPNKPISPTCLSNISNLSVHHFQLSNHPAIYRPIYPPNLSICDPI